MRIGKIANSAEYRVDEQLQNLPTSRVKFQFSKLNNSINSLIFGIVKFEKFVNFFNWKNSRNLLSFLNFKIREIC